jgi:hypothetical protein
MKTICEVKKEGQPNNDCGDPGQGSVDGKPPLPQFLHVLERIDSAYQLSRQLIRERLFCQHFLLTILRVLSIVIRMVG